MRDLPTDFPFDETPIVTAIEFERAGVQVKGKFRLNEFALLVPEQLEFLRLYIKVRGNLKEVERMLGVSYPTVRARFDQMIRALGYEDELVELDERSTVLSRLEQGELDVEQAIERLRRL